MEMPKNCSIMVLERECRCECGCINGEMDEVKGLEAHHLQHAKSRVPGHHCKRACVLRSLHCSKICDWAKPVEKPAAGVDLDSTAERRGRVPGASLFFCFRPSVEISTTENCVVDSTLGRIQYLELPPKSP